MKGQAVEELSCILHQHIGPVVVVTCRTAGNLVNLVAVLSHIRLIPLVVVAVELCGHVSAAAPVFISNAKVMELPRLVMSVCTAHQSVGGVSAARQILNPLGHLFNRTAPDVAADIWFAHMVVTA